MPYPPRTTVLAVAPDVVGESEARPEVVLVERARVVEARVAQVVEDRRLEIVAVRARLQLVSQPQVQRQPAVGMVVVLEVDADVRPVVVGLVRAGRSGERVGDASSGKRRALLPGSGSAKLKKPYSVGMKNPP